mmetsp:Transcript_14729/g.33152  ORF Transcript_14729/g.33152 Transcript_14729/m.33152 type:complete len:370 (+) Transcript_14729:85-1194(+)
MDVWIKVKGGRSRKYKQEELISVSDVTELLDVVFKAVQQRLPQGVAVDSLKMCDEMSNEEFETCEPIKELTDRGYGTYEKPLYVDYIEPSAAPASSSGQVISLAAALSQLGQIKEALQRTFPKWESFRKKARSSAKSEASKCTRQAIMQDVCVICGDDADLSCAHLLKHRKEVTAMGIEWSRNFLCLCGSENSDHSNGGHPSCHALFDHCHIGLLHLQDTTFKVLGADQWCHNKEVQIPSNPSKTLLHSHLTLGIVAQSLKLIVADELEEAGDASRSSTPPGSVEEGNHGKGKDQGNNKGSGKQLKGKNAQPRAQPRAQQGAKAQPKAKAQPIAEQSQQPRGRADGTERQWGVRLGRLGNAWGQRGDAV